MNLVTTELLSRRALLKLSASVVTAASCCPTVQPLPTIPPDAAAGIDVHCHLFNASDLPVWSFVTEVYLEGFERIFEPEIILIGLVMESIAPDYNRERTYLTY